MENESKSALDTYQTEQKLIDAILSGHAPQSVTAEPALDLDALILKARTELSVASAKVDKKALEAPDAELVNTLLAQADEFKRTIDAATKERAKITDFLGDLIEAAESAPGDIEELTVHGATVFTSKIATSRILNQSHIKSLFPDIAENAEMYVDSSSRKRLYK